MTVQNKISGGAKAVLGAATFAALMTGVALAQPALVYDVGGKNDKSFNEMAWNGAEAYTKATGNPYQDLEIQTDAQREQALRRFAQQGANPIVVPGFTWGGPLDVVAQEFPDTHFAIIDMVVDQPNVRSVVFNEHEGSYLVGMMAAMASKSGTVGFIGGMDIPLIRKFACGYVQGVKATNASATVIQNMTGTTPSAWNDPVKGAELTKAQIGQGADVVYAAAGGTGVGVLQTAADEGVYSIGVDSNQNYLHPGSVLTSMLKRVDVAVYNAFSAGAGLETGFHVLGTANGGIDYSVDENNASIFTDDIKAAVDAAKAGIIDGSIQVHDYMSDSSCPVE